MGDILGFLFGGLSLVIFIVWCFQWFLHILAIGYGRYKLHRYASLASPASGSELEALEDGSDDLTATALLQGVSVIKPLMGIDSNLFANLETFFTIAYDKFELLFCVEDADDPAVMIVKRLIAKYPNVNAKLFSGAAKVGINPKINNMLEAYKSSNYELVLISDSGLRMKEDTLSHMVAALNNKTGLVHQLPFTSDRRDGFATVLEKVYFGTQHAKMYLSADVFDINCVTGMSTLFRKSVLDEAGGLGVLSGFLAEDFYLGPVFTERGWKVNICNEPAEQNAGNCSVTCFQERMMRWRKLRVSLVPFTALVLEPITECMLCGLLTSLAVNILFAWNCLVFFFVHLLIWFLLDYLLLITVQGGRLPFTKLEYVAGWFFREITSFPLMIRAHQSGRTLKWRAKIYRIRPGGIGEEIKPQTTEL